MRKTYKVVRKRTRRGGSLKSFLSSANSFLKRSRILSSLGTMYSNMGLPYGAQVGLASGVARSMGYGKRRMRRGGALTPAGY